MPRSCLEYVFRPFLDSGFAYYVRAITGRALSKKQRSRTYSLCFAEDWRDLENRDRNQDPNRNELTSSLTTEAWTHDFGVRRWTETERYPGLTSWFTTEESGYRHTGSRSGTDPLNEPNPDELPELRERGYNASSLVWPNK